MDGRSIQGLAPRIQYMHQVYFLDRSITLECLRDTLAGRSLYFLEATAFSNIACTLRKSGQSFSFVSFVDIKVGHCTNDESSGPN